MLYYSSVNPPRCTPENYIDFLVASAGPASCTEAARVQPHSPFAPAHDSYNRLLNRLEPDPEQLWREAEPLVEKARGALVIDDSTLDKRRAEHIGTRPIWLPDASPTTRNVITYSAWAMIGWVLQCGLLLASAENDFGTIAWSLCGLPAVAFFAGYLTVSTVGQPRVGASHPKQARLGGAICFVGMPLLWIALVAARSMLIG